MKLTCLSTALLILTLGAPALAQTYSERPYNPPVGSRWQIVSESDSAEDREVQKREQHISSTAELTIEEKLPDGFRIAYVSREIKVGGNAPGTDIAGAAFQTMKNIVIRARTDQAGKPVAIENLDEVRGKMRTVVESMSAAFAAQPQVAKVLKDMLEGMLILDGAQAAQAYIEDVPNLASVHNTGLRPNAEARAFEETPNPLGGTMRTVVITKLTNWDAAKGTAQYHQTREFDKDALQAFVLALVRKFQPAAGSNITPDMIEMMKQIKFNMTSDSVFAVEDGMTRGVVGNSTIEVSLMGHKFTKVEKKKVAVTRLN